MKKRFLWPVLFMVVLALSRWPGVMPQNFSAVYAIVFCSGLFLTGWAGWVIPLGVLALTDFALDYFHYERGHFSLVELILGVGPNYFAYAGLIALGRAFSGKRRPWWSMVGGGLFGALLFYIVTNTAAWMSLPYAKTLAGWIQALTRGLPGYPPTWEFFRSTLLSGGLFTGLFVGAMKLTAESESAREKEAEEEESSDAPEAEPAKAES